MNSLQTILAAVHCAFLLPLALLGLHRAWLTLLYLRARRRPAGDPPPPAPAELPRVTVQLPIYDERYVAARLLRAVAALDYPHDRLQIQVLDDSTDDTSAIVARTMVELPAGLRVDHVRRADRTGFKAGALAAGLETATGELVAVFDADFVPPRDFLRRTVPYFADPRVGMVQSRWDHLNPDYSLLTETQATLLDGHFVVEHTARAASGCFFNFNGTGGVFRRSCIDDAGGWQHDTLTEDMDLSYRAQLRGWRFVYLPDLACPAELPVAVAGFVNQQHRWAKGSVQVGRKLFPAILRADLPLLTKVEAGVHLFGNVAFPLLLGLILVALPLQIVRLRDGVAVPPLLAAVEGAPLFLATASVLVYYGLARHRLGRLGAARLLRLPVVLALGAGLCVANSAAVLGALRRDPGEFARTPKAAVLGRQRTPWTIAYASPRGWLPWLELAVGAWAATTASTAFAIGLPWTGAFHGLFACGLAWVGAGSLRRQQPASELDPRPGKAVAS